MKKVILFIIMLMIVFFGISRADHHDYDYEYYKYSFNDYYNYDDNEYRHIEDEYFLDDHQGDIYYYYHSIPGLYFVLAGPRVYIMPRALFRRYLSWPNFLLISQPDFIEYSRGSLGYYDSYVRFNYYYNYYIHYPWNLRNHFQVCWNYRHYYGDRYHNRGYFNHYNRIMQSINQKKPKYKSYKNQYIHKAKESSKVYKRYIAPNGYSSKPKVRVNAPDNAGQSRTSFYNQGRRNNYISTYFQNQGDSRKHCSHSYYYIKPKPVPPGLIVNRYDLLRKHQGWHNHWWFPHPINYPPCKNREKPNRTYNNSGSPPKAYDSQPRPKPRSTFSTSHSPNNTKTPNSPKNSHRIRLRRR